MPLAVAAFLLVLAVASPLAAPPASGAKVPRLELGALLEPGRRLVPSARARVLHGRRVRLVGYMAQLEEGPRGAFFLAARPVRCDEGGAGTGDLPPDAVRVVVRSAAGEPVPFYPGLLETAGVFLVGNVVDDQGRPALFQLVLDAPDDLQRALPVR